MSGEGWVGVRDDHTSILLEPSGVQLINEGQPASDGLSELCAECPVCFAALYQASMIDVRTDSMMSVWNWINAACERAELLQLEKKHPGEKHPLLGFFSAFGTHADVSSSGNPPWHHPLPL